MNNFAADVFFICKGKVDLFDELMQITAEYDPNDIIGFEEFDLYLNLKYKKKYIKFYRRSVTNKILSSRKNSKDNVIEEDDDEINEEDEINLLEDNKSMIALTTSGNGSEKSKLSSVHFKDSSKIKYKNTAIGQYDIFTEYIAISFINLEEIITNNIDV